MKLNLECTNKVISGDYLNSLTKTIFEEPNEILWGGLKLFCRNPCKKELIIAKSEIFSEGIFESGEYIRKRSTLINPIVVPTIEARSINYLLRMSLRVKSPINKQEEMEIFQESPVKIITKRDIYQKRDITPIKLLMSGLNIEIPKDIFRPGEVIKIDYHSDNLTLLQMRLKQKANLVCICEPYGTRCGSVEELPPVIAGGAKTSKTDQGVLLIKIPEHAEPSHEYLWKPSEKEKWGVQFGDYSKWYLEVIGNRKREMGGDTIFFEIPIIIKTTKGKEMVDTGLFRERKENAELFKPLPAIVKGIKIISIDTDKNNTSHTFVYRLLLENNLNETLEGVTIENSGVQKGLFETYKHMTGFEKWLPGEEKTIEYKTRQEVDTLISIIEDNSHKSLRIQKDV